MWKEVNSGWNFNGFLSEFEKKWIQGENFNGFLSEFGSEFGWFLEDIFPIWIQTWKFSSRAARAECPFSLSQPLTRLLATSQIFLERIMTAARLVQYLEASYPAKTLLCFCFALCWEKWVISYCFLVRTCAKTSRLLTEGPTFTNALGSMYVCFRKS